MARFEREAKTLGSLNHPQIAAVYGFEKSTTIHALVMELVEGEDLSQRIARGAIPLDEALPIAKQIADALEAAHERGIVHRDVKPANIKLTNDGHVKVLDFGLAKALDDDRLSPPYDAASTTINLATKAGVILGTAPYMSPEQAKGQPVDRRTDIWSFGCVLYEMLVGRRAFESDSLSELLAAILTHDVDLSRIPPDTPAGVRELLRRCLDRDPKQRLRDIGEVMPVWSPDGARLAYVSERILVETTVQPRPLRVGSTSRIMPFNYLVPRPTRSHDAAPDGRRFLVTTWEQTFVVTETIAAVVRDQPDWTRLPPDVPQHVRLLLKKCLEKRSPGTRVRRCGRADDCRRSRPWRRSVLRCGRDWEASRR